LAECVWVIKTLGWQITSFNCTDINKQQYVKANESVKFEEKLKRAPEKYYSTNTPFIWSLLTADGAGVCFMC